MVAAWHTDFEHGLATGAASGSGDGAGSGHALPYALGLGAGRRHCDLCPQTPIASLRSSPRQYPRYSGSPSRIRLEWVNAWVSTLHSPPRLASSTSARLWTPAGKSPELDSGCTETVPDSHRRGATGSPPGRTDHYWGTTSMIPSLSLCAWQVANDHFAFGFFVASRRFLYQTMAGGISWSEPRLSTRGNISCQKASSLNFWKPSEPSSARV